MVIGSVELWYLKFQTSVLADESEQAPVAKLGPAPHPCFESHESSRESLVASKSAPREYHKVLCALHPRASVGAELEQRRAPRQRDCWESRGLQAVEQPAQKRSGFSLGSCARRPQKTSLPRAPGAARK